MYYEIHACLSDIHMQFGPSTQMGIGLFTPLDVFIGVRAYIGEEIFITFDVHDDGRLTFTNIN